MCPWFPENRQYRERYEYDKDGNVKTYTGPSNNRIEYEYDNMGRVTDTFYYGVKDEYGKELEYLKESNEYDWEGNVTKSEMKAVYTDGEEKIHSLSEYYYDGRGQLLVSIDKLEEDGEWKDVVNSYAYDNAGRLVQEALPGSFDTMAQGSQNPIEKYSVDNARSKTKYTYDLMGRVRTKEFCGEVYEYDAHSGEMQKKETSFLIKAFEYDSNDNVVKVVEGKEYKRASANSKSIDETIKNAMGTIYTYTLSNNVETVTYPEEASRNKDFSIWYDYDSLGNVVLQKTLKGASNTGSMVEYIALTSMSYDQNADGTITYTKTTQIENPAESNAYAQGTVTQIWKTDINGNVIEDSVGKNKKG